MKDNSIRLFREIKGYSQQYVAHRINRSQAAFSRIENGQTFLSDGLLQQISNVLEISTEKLIEDKKDLFQSINKEAMADLLYVLAENKKLLNDINLNQQKLQEQLNIFMSKIIAKNI